MKNVMLACTALTTLSLACGRAPATSQTQAVPKTAHVYVKNPTAFAALGRSYQQDTQTSLNDAVVDAAAQDMVDAITAYAPPPNSALYRSVATVELDEAAADTVMELAWTVDFNSSKNSTIYWAGCQLVPTVKFYPKGETDTVYSLVRGGGEYQNGRDTAAEMLQIFPTVCNAGDVNPAVEEAFKSL